MRKIFAALMVASLTIVGLAQSPYNLNIYKAQSFTGDGSGVVIPLNGNSSGSTVGSSFASGNATVSVVGSGTATIGFVGSSDNGVTYVPIPITSLTASPTTATTQMVTASSVFSVPLGNLTHVQPVVSGSFTFTSITILLTASPNAQMAKSSQSSSVSGTVGAGNANQLAVYPSNGTAVQGSSSLPSGVTVPGSQVVINQNQLSNVIASVQYTEGSSWPRCAHVGGSPSGTTVAGGGCSNSMMYILSQSNIGKGMGVPYNDSIDGSTSAQAAARWSTGNSTYGVTVPSAQSLSPQAMCSAFSTNPASCPKEYWFIGMDVAYNDFNNGVSLSTTESTIQGAINVARAAGYIVGVLTDPLCNPGNIPANSCPNDQTYQANQYAIANKFGADFVMRPDLYIENQSDLNFYDTDFVHLNPNGQFTAAQGLIDFFSGIGVQASASRVGRGLLGWFGPYNNFNYAANASTIARNGVNIFQPGDYIPGSNNAANGPAFFIGENTTPSTAHYMGCNHATAWPTGPSTGSGVCYIISQNPGVGNSATLINWGFGPVYLGPTIAPSYMETLTTPASSSATCVAGQFTDDSSYHYVCTGTNAWKRVLMTTF